MSEGPPLSSYHLQGTEDLLAVYPFLPLLSLQALQAGRLSENRGGYKCVDNLKTRKGRD